MKSILILSVCCLIACRHRVDKGQEVSNQQKVEHIVRKYVLGDVDGDAANDTATVTFGFDFDTNQLACPTPNCAINIAFSKGIPDLDIDQTLGIFIQSAPDLDGDGRSDLLLFSRTYEGCWNDILAFGFHDGDWLELAKTKCFLADDDDAKNRIFKTRNGYFILGDDWNDDQGGVVARSLKVGTQKVRP